MFAQIHENNSLHTHASKHVVKFRILNSENFKLTKYWRQISWLLDAPASCSQIQLNTIYPPGTLKLEKD